MDALPPCLVLEILNRLDDAADLARCRLVSKSMASLACDVRVLKLVCTMSRYQKSRSPHTADVVTPFKTILSRNLIPASRNLESVSIAIDPSCNSISYDDWDDDSDDFYLNDAVFVEEWLSKICDGLKFLSISDFWIQSCYRKSQVLALISSLCKNLVELELKNAWLSVENLVEMPTLRMLTLEFIRLDDENLDKVSKCFPYLKVLNLLGVGGLRDPKIFLVQLQSCEWMVSNAPHSLTVVAPSLTTLKLRCIKPQSLILDTPLLSALHLSMEDAMVFDAVELKNLESLKLQSSNALKLVRRFPSGVSVKRLTVDSTRLEESVETSRLSLDAITEMFPNINSLALSARAWTEMEDCFEADRQICESELTQLRSLTAHVVVRHLETSISFIRAIVKRCHELRDVELHIDRDAGHGVLSEMMTRCREGNGKVVWRWGLWKERGKQ